MKHYLHYKKNENSGILEFDANSVVYVDTSSETPVLYKNPLEHETMILLSAKNVVFVVNHHVAQRLVSESPYAVNGFEFRLKASDYAIVPLYQKYKPILINALKSRRNRPYFLASVAILLIAVIFLSAYDSDSLSNRSGFESSIHELQPDLSGNELVEMRLKLAKQAFAEKKYALAIDLTDKILSVRAGEPRALEIREMAIQGENADKTGQKLTLKKDIHAKSLMDEATELLTKRDYDGALFQLEQILSENPNDPDALKLQATIQDSLKKTNEEKQNESLLQNQAVNQAQTLWKQGESSLSQKNYAAAWQQLSQALEMLEKSQSDTFFKSDLKTSLAQVEMELYNQTQPLVEQAKTLLADGDRQTGNKQIIAYKNSLSNYMTAKQKFSKYPFLENEISIATKKLNESLKPLYTEAQVTEDLEGCCQAQPYYAKVMQNAQFEMVPYYKKAQEAMSQCTCR